MGTFKGMYRGIQGYGVWGSGSMYPPNWVPLRGYIAVYKDIWGLGFRVHVPHGLGTEGFGNSHYSA